MEDFLIVVQGAKAEVIPQTDKARTLYNQPVTMNADPFFFPANVAFLEDKGFTTQVRYEKKA